MKDPFWKGYLVFCIVIGLGGAAVGLMKAFYNGNDIPAWWTVATIVGTPVLLAVLLSPFAIVHIIRKKTSL